MRTDPLYSFSVILNQLLLAFLRIYIRVNTRASRGITATAELLVNLRVITKITYRETRSFDALVISSYCLLCKLVLVDCLCDVLRVLSLYSLSVQ